MSNTGLINQEKLEGCLTYIDTSKQCLIYDKEEPFKEELEDCLHRKGYQNIHKMGEQDYFSLKEYVDANKTEVIFYQKENARLIYDILWGCRSVEFVVCLDSESILKEKDRKNKLMNKRIWNLAAINAADDIECGGWMSSYTREKFSMDEIHDFVDNTKNKLGPYLSKEQTVLEIGCASGFTMYSLAGYVKKYVGIDMSNVSVERNQKKIQEEGIGNIEVQCMQAHEIASFPDNTFDVILLNSVVHCFEGYHYLIGVLSTAIQKIKSQGILYLGDIMDLDLKNDFYQSLKEYEKEHECYTKTDISNELLLSRKFFDYLQKECKDIANITITKKSGKIQNELVKYRYDVVIEIKKQDGSQEPMTLGTKSCDVRKKES